MDLLSAYSVLKAAWVVWFFLLFGFILVWVLRPGRRRAYQAMAEIPLQDAPPAPAKRSL